MKYYLNRIKDIFNDYDLNSFRQRSYYKKILNELKSKWFEDDDEEEEVGIGMY